MRALILACCLVTPAVAAPLWEVKDHADSSRVVLHDDPCPWAATAQLAAWHGPDGKTVPGCWLMVDDWALIVYVDGDRGRIAKRNLVRVISL